MKPSHVVWCVVIALAAVTPIGLKALTWKGPPKHTIDSSMADAGKVLFEHKWKPNDPLSPGGDGLGPVFNAESCVACHKQGGPGGGGDLQANVTTFTIQPTGAKVTANGQIRTGVVHAKATKFQETLAHVSPELPQVSQPALKDLIPEPNGMRKISFPLGVHISQRNTPALFGAKLLDEIADEAIIANEKTQQLKWGLAKGKDKADDVMVGRALRLSGGRVGKFGWKAQTATLSEFVVAACANELGLGNPGQAQPAPLGKPDYKAPGLDLSSLQCDQLTEYLVSLPKPIEALPEDKAGRERVEAGKTLFSSVGCADCHIPDVGPAKGVYSDLLLHSMGQDLEGGGSYGDPPIPLPDVPPESGPSPGEWRTPPLWGVADSAPYLHDGRAATLEDAIRMHGGQGSAVTRRYERLAPNEKAQVVAFLKTLRAP